MTAGIFLQGGFCSRNGNGKGNGGCFYMSFHSLGALAGALDFSSLSQQHLKERKKGGIKEYSSRAGARSGQWGCLLLFWSWRESLGRSFDLFCFFFTLFHHGEGSCRSSVFLLLFLFDFCWLFYKQPIMPNNVHFVFIFWVVGAEGKNVGVS